MRSQRHSPKNRLKPVRLRHGVSPFPKSPLSGEIIVNSIPRSGSTICDQICQEFGFDVCREHNGVVVRQYHHEKKPMIVTMRDPLDIMLSTKKLIEKIPNKTYGFTKHVLKDWYDRKVHLLEENDYYLMIRYEDYIHNPKQRIRDIGHFLGVDCSEERVDDIHSRTSIERNREIASQYDNFDTYCKKTLIHGGHISDDPYGENRDLSLIDSDTMDFIERCRKAFGYI